MAHVPCEHKLSVHSSGFLVTTSRALTQVHSGRSCRQIPHTQHSIHNGTCALQTHPHTHTQTHSLCRNSKRWRRPGGRFEFANPGPVWTLYICEKFELYFHFTMAHVQCKQKLTMAHVHFKHSHAHSNTLSVSELQEVAPPWWPF